jgi:hypothetical protein
MDLKIVGYGEHRHIEKVVGPDGQILDMSPVQGSESASLDLQLPSGKVLKASISHADFVAEVVPLFGRSTIFSKT